MLEVDLNNNKIKSTSRIFNAAGRNTYKYTKNETTTSKFDHRYTARAQFLKNFVYFNRIQCLTLFFLVSFHSSLRTFFYFILTLICPLCVRL